ncbi:HlyD family efflux transporter periplasmic adaptor subunit [Faecalicatena contorta]|uniref:HlyD family efflux transporter periplasmic adaptor subunit n=1 Tax=Faecalicatena contorta TaxID=39482 RepID=UPI001F28EBA2|nr:HlyD family efflux transporter periplasmic adaptor subunit [Faecalicatena contorta]
MADKNNVTNITVFRKKWNINIGVFLFGVIFIYLIVTVLLYLTGQHVSAYEVREGTILKDNAYTGFIVRNEQVVTAEADGYVNYFAPEGSKVGARTNVYSLSSQELDFADTSASETEELSAEERDAIFGKTQSFSDSFHPEQFSDVYTLKNNIQSVLESKSSQSRQAQLEEMLASGVDGLQVYPAAGDGIIIYATDGYESTTVSDVTANMISTTDYILTGIKNNEKIKAGEPVYKLIKDDHWSIAILLEDDTARELAEVSRVKVRFSKDNETTRADFAIYNTKDANIGFLTFDSSMIRYAKERYLDIELILEDETGLKIPKSSVVKKSFYLVPESYLTQGGNSKETGVLIDSGKDNAEFKKVDIYYRDNENGMVYLDPNVFDKNTTLLKPDSTETYTLKKTKALKGVYNINKGYAVFKQIKILCESEEYYIVESGNDYGLANYDHIALIGEDVQENDVVF